MISNTSNTRMLVRKTCILVLEPCISFTGPLVFSILGRGGGRGAVTPTEGEVSYSLPKLLSSALEFTSPVWGLRDCSANRSAGPGSRRHRGCLVLLHMYNRRKQY